jgi:hypothetical protein
MQTLGFILITIGTVWFYVVVMSQSIGWFLACLFFPPAPFLFWLQHEEKVRWPALTWIVGLLLVIVGGYTPLVRDGRFRGSWTGVTDQGEAITFQVASDTPFGFFPLLFGERGISESAYNISTAVQFDPTCPIGRVSLSSTQSRISNGHIFGYPGPNYYFRVLNMQTPNTTASISGEFTSSITAAGAIRVVDYRRDLQDRLDHPCPFSMEIGWTATKVSP